MRYFSLLLLAFIAAHANGKLICADNSNFCQIVKDFDNNLTWEKSKPIGSNQEYEEQDYGMSLQTDGDMLITGNILSPMSQKYKAPSLNKISHNVKELAKEIRNPDKNLYEIAKSVGRIDKIHDDQIVETEMCEKEGMGTATLVKWNGMPKEMEGRVLLTCLHNHNLFALIVRPDLFGKKLEEIESDKVVHLEKDGERYKKWSNVRDLYFTLDESNEKNNVRGYGITKNSRKVKCCYYKEKNKNNHDIAIFILDEPIKGVTPVEIFQTGLENIKLNDGDQVIGVGYGRSNAHHEYEGTRFLDGWNIKKKINATCKPKGNFLNICTGTGLGDSGSLLFTEKAETDTNNAKHDLIAIGIVTGGTGDPMIHPHMDWMKAAVDDFAKAKTESAE